MRRLRSLRLLTDLFVHAHSSIHIHVAHDGTARRAKWAPRPGAQRANQCLLYERRSGLWLSAEHVPRVKDSLLAIQSESDR